jgi:putative transposase
MAKKRYAPEQIINKLGEAKVLIEQWQSEYNQVRPHSALRYHPPAPGAILITT